MRAGLHLHSLFSDGTEWPEQVARRARAAGLELAALTDHDCLEGVPRFLAACATEGMRGVAGVEVDCVAPEIGFDMELLLYFPGGRYERTRSLLLRRCATRRRLVARFLEETARAQRWSLSLDGLLRHKLGGAEIEGLSLSKTDIYFYLRGLQLIPTAQTYPEFKARHFPRGKVAPSDGDEPKPHVTSLLATARADGGVAVVPHPVLMLPGARLDGEGDVAELRRRLGWLRDAGVWGVEIYQYRDRPTENNAVVERLAAELGLGLTFGSDAHGPGTKTPAIDAMTGEFTGFPQGEER